MSRQQWTQQFSLSCIETRFNRTRDYAIWRLKTIDITQCFWKIKLRLKFYPHPFMIKLLSASVVYTVCMCTRHSGRDGFMIAVILGWAWDLDIILMIPEKLTTLGHVRILRIHIIQYLTPMMTVKGWSYQPSVSWKRATFNLKGVVPSNFPQSDWIIDSIGEK